MFAVLTHLQYRRLFAAQVSALLGTGLLTVALGLLAFDLAGDRAGAVLGTALAIKMVAYVGLSPIANALAERWPRKTVLVVADLVRAAVALSLPFIESVWQIYVAIFVLQAASATFTPTFQALIPDVLKEEDDYTKALSLSRLAYELENLLSPTLAGLLLLVISYSWLFVGTFIGFVISAIWVVTTPLPGRPESAGSRPFFDRVTRGARIYLATPRLRGLLCLNMAASAAGAFIIVNTVVLVRNVYAGSEAAVALALAAFGAGAMLAAFALPRILAAKGDRTVMSTAAAGLTALTLLHGIWFSMGALPWIALLLLYGASGACYSSILTPVGRLITRSTDEDARPSVFTAQFALSHACWLITYPLAGWLGLAVGLNVVLLVLGAIAALSVIAALRLWPKDDPEILRHSHPDLPPDHPHLRQHGHNSGVHEHRFVIDDIHRAWPR